MEYHPLSSLDHDSGYDLVIKPDPYAIRAVVFAPSKDDQGYDSIQAQIEAERGFGLQCIKVGVHHPCTVI